MQTGLTLAPLSLTMFGTAVLAGKRAGRRRPAALIRAGAAWLTVGTTSIAATASAAAAANPGLALDMSRLPFSCDAGQLGN